MDRGGLYLEISFLYEHQGIRRSLPSRTTRCQLIRKFTLYASWHHCKRKSEHDVQLPDVGPYRKYHRRGDVQRSVVGPGARTLSRESQNERNSKIRILLSPRWRECARRY